MDQFTGAESSALAARKRMRWLSSVLRAAVQRASLVGLDPARMTEIFRALEAYDIALSVGGTVATPATLAASQVIRLEVSYVMPGPEAR